MSFDYIYNPGYYVPVAVKSRDYLVGFLDALDALSIVVQVDFEALSSQRFNDYLPNNQRRRDLTDEQIVEVLNEYEEGRCVKEVGVEKKVDIDGEEDEDYNYFEINCSCGNYHSFQSSEEIPKSDFKCEICGKTLIEYLGKDDDEIDYDGDVERAFIGLLDDEEDDEEED